MIIEQNTNYAYKLQYMENPSFDKVRDLSTRFYRELPKELQDKLYEKLNRGLDVLDSEPQMLTYLYAFGKMHQAKLDYAFNHLLEKFLAQPEINIIDYGCGQALGVMCYADYLHDNGYRQRVKTITLIEPSEMCLKRAALHASVFFPGAEIKTINKKFDDLMNKDVVCDEETPTLHILSNVLDMLDFDLDKFANLVKGCLKGYNQFVCVGPYFNYLVKDERTRKLCSLIQGKESFYKTFDKNEFHNEKEWTAQIFCFSKGVKKTTLTKEDLKLIGEYDIDTYMRMFHTTTLGFVKNPKNPSSLFFSCGLKPNGKRNFGAIGPKALERIKVDGFTNDNKKVFIIRVYEIRNIEGELMTMPILLLNNNVNVVASFSNIESEEEELSTAVTDEDIENGVEDDFGIIYSRNGKRLLKCKNESIIFYEIKQGTRVISREAFCGCPLLQQITIPNSVTQIGDYAFALCNSLQQIIIPDPVTIIGDGTFHGCESLQQIFIPNTVKSIGEYAFSECKSLKQIVLPKIITKIKYRTFYLCYSLLHINIPNSVTSIEADAFYGCAMIQLNIPDSVTSIGKAAFSNCRSIQQIIIPELVTEICDETFTECTSLRQVIIPNSVTRIGKDAFSYCLSLEQIIIPNSVTNIAESTFYDCRSLKQVTIPNSITYIGELAFCGCNSLQQFIIPKTVKAIESGVFNNCYGIILNSKTSRYIVQDKLLIDKFENKIISYYGNDIDIIIPDSVMSIGECAFIHCDSLQHVIIPKSITNIKKYAFYDCQSLQQVTIPDSVISIGKQAFEGCGSMQKIIIPKRSKQRFLELIQENMRDKLVEV